MDDFLVFSSPPHPARDGGSHWAGAQRPKAGTEERDMRRNDVNTTAGSREDATAPDKSTNSVYTAKNPINLNLKLRRQALSQGMIPGSPRWRAYVLGTVSAARKRKREKRDRKTEGKQT